MPPSEGRGVAAWVVAAALLGVSGLQITELRVPPAVLNGSASVVLDCDYSLKPEELNSDAGLVVKWFFNNSPMPVYQWIPGQKPQDLGIFKGRIDLDYKVSGNRNNEHRALKIHRPTTELSGEYRCYVSTFKDEDFMSKKMVVIAPEQKLDFSREKEAVACTALAVYPEPKMALLRDTGSSRREALPDVKMNSTFDGGLFNVSAFALLPEGDLQPSMLHCEMRIPDTNYAVKKTLVYYPGLLLSNEGPKTLRLEPFVPSIIFLTKLWIW